jgi:hypothetical protein
MGFGTKGLDAEICIKSLGNATRDNNEQLAVKIRDLQK